MNIPCFFCILFADITIELRALGVPWTLHCWMHALAAAHELRLDTVIDQLLQDFLQVCPDDYSQQFVTECLPLLFSIFRYSKVCVSNNFILHFLIFVRLYALNLPDGSILSLFAVTAAVILFSIHMHSIYTCFHAVVTVLCYCLFLFCCSRAVEDNKGNT